MICNQISYQSALSKIDNAINVIKNNTELEEKKKELLQEYRACVQEEVKLAEKQEKYEQAISAIDGILLFFPQDTEFMNLKNQMINEQFIGSIDDVEKSNDYSSIKKFLVENDNLDNLNKESLSRLNDLKKKFRTETIAQADSSLKEMGYNQANKILEDALRVLPKEDELLALQKRYQVYKPLYLSEITPFQGEGEWKANITDLQGKKYDSAFILKGNAISKKDPTCYENHTELEYFLGGQYSHLTGTVANYARNTDFNEKDLYLEIFADDIKIYQSEAITPKTQAFDFDISIENPQYISILAVFPYSGYEKILLSDTYFYNPIE